MGRPRHNPASPKLSPLNMRVDPLLRAMIEASAVANERSLTAEVESRLRSTFPPTIDAQLAEISEAEERLVADLAVLRGAREALAAESPCTAAPSKPADLSSAGDWTGNGNSIPFQIPISRGHYENTPPAKPMERIEG